MSGTTGKKTVAVPEGIFTLHLETNVRITAKEGTRVQIAREGEEFAPSVMKE